MKKYTRLALKVILWGVGILIFLAVLIFILIQAPAVQNYARQKTVRYLERKLKTRVEINKLSFDFPKLLVLEDVYFEDQKRDTLLPGDTLKVNLSLFKLLQNQVEINEIDLRGITVNAKRTAGGVVNFDYIVKAFLREENKNPYDTTGLMKFSVRDINLDRIRASYKDAMTSSDVSLYLRHFDTSIKSFDLDKMGFDIPAIKLSGLSARIIQYKPAAKPESFSKDSVDAAKFIDMNLKLGTISLDAVQLYYQNDISSVKSDIILSKVNVVSNNIDIKNKLIALRSANIQDSKVLLQFGRTQQAKVAAREAAKEIQVQAQNWQVAVNDMDLRNNEIIFDDFNKPVLKRGVDYSHLDIKGLTLRGRLNYATDSISGNILAGSFSDKSGLELKKIQANFFYGPNHINLDKLYLETPYTIIKNQIRLNYSSVEDIARNIGELGIETDLKNNKLGLRDVVLFMPELAAFDPFRSNPNSSFNITGRLSGKINNLNISNLDITGLTNTRIRGSGRITGLPNTQKAYYNVAIREFRSGSRDLNLLVSKGVIPSNVRMPQTFNLSGTFKGTTTNFNTNLSLNSSFGAAKVVGSMKGNSYDADMNLNKFQVGRFIMKDSIVGLVTGSAKVKGTGFDPKKIHADFSANIQSAEVRGYTYHNVVIDGNIADQDINAVASIDDPNIKLKLDAKANITNTYPSVVFTADIDSVNLQALKWYDGQLLLRGKITGNLPSTDPDNLVGKIYASDLLVVSGGKRYQLDSVDVIASMNGDQRDLRFHSDLLSANLTGKYTLTEISNAVINEINKYFKIGDGKVLPVSNTQDFSFNIHAVNQPFLQQFFPQLTKMESADISGSFNSSTGALVLNGSIPELTYMGYSFSNLRLSANTDAGALNYSINLDQASSPTIKINKTTLTGKAQNNLLNVDLNVKDAGGKDQYKVAGLFSALQNQYQFKFNPNGLMLNYDSWTVSADNVLEFGPGGILAQNFGLSRAGQQIIINSTPRALNAPLAISFTDFKIETITAIAKRDSLLAGGVINGTALLSNFHTNSPLFTADVKIKDFNFMTDTVGDVELQINNSQANTYAARARITGRGNDLVVNGFYYLKPQNGSNFDLDMDINTLNLASAQGFTLGYIRKATGSVNGKLKITGTFSSPVVRGDVNFKDAGFTVSMLNSFYRIADERVSFTSDGIELDNFTVLDSAGNEAILDGNIYTTNFFNYEFDLSLRTDNFMALNSTKKDNDLYYGTIVLSSSLNITGDINKPVVTGRVMVNDKTNFTVVLPQNDPALQEREGIVEFVNMSDPEAVLAFKNAALDSLKTSDIRGINLTMNIEVDSMAIFNIIIDEGNGDYVKVQGQAQLSAGIDPGGKILLTGDYVLTQGAYEMSYNFIKRRFDIQRGSTIIWTGELTSAQLNVNAIYTANAAPLDLVDNQLGAVTATERNRYKQRLPFEVYLTLQGELLKPEITFDIDLPTGRNYFVSREVITLVNTRLDQLRNEPNELNKQVFSLLLLSRFTSENPFNNKAGSGTGAIETFVRQSVSRILTDQLNELAGSIIQGVDLNFDLVSSEDYTSGELRNRTDLNVGLSKRLLNDRLKVTIGSNFELEGPQNSNQPANGIAGNIALDYQISQDGKYMLRAYRKNVTDAVIEGYVIETGLSFIISMDYNKFREVFMHRTDEDKFIRKEIKEERKRKRKEAKQPPEVNA